MPTDTPASTNAANPTPASPAPARTTVRDRISAFFPVVVRCLLAADFLYMGMNKVHDPVVFLKLVDQYNLTSNALILNVIAAALPWFEVFCGLLLFTGVAVRGTSLVVLSMLL